jgi:hypothetical protein
VNIEWHTHVYPPEEAAADARTFDGKGAPTWAGRCPMTCPRPAARLVLDTVGADHVLHGSDAPPLTSLKPRANELVEGLNLPPPEREAVFWRHAAVLLKLPAASEAKPREIPILPRAGHFAFIQGSPGAT